MSTFRLEILKPKNTTYLTSDGRLYLDVNKEQRLISTKQLSDLQEVNRLKRQIFREFTLPMTPRNVQVFREYGNANSFNFKNIEPLEVSIGFKGFIWLNTTLAVTGFNDTTKSIDVIVYGTDYSWAGDLLKVKVHELDLGTLVNFSWQVIDGMHSQGKNLYSDGDLGAFVPFVNYGQTEIPDMYSVTDLRVWVSPLNVLRKGFCKAGYSFKCPLLELDEWRRLWVYLLAEDFETKVLSTNLSFNAVLTSDLPIPQFVWGNPPLAYVIFDNDVTEPAFDVGNNYDSNTGAYSGVTAVCDYFADVTVTGSVDNLTLGAAISVKIRKRNVYTDLTQDVGSGSINLTSSSGTFNIKVTALDVFIDTYHEVFVEVIGINFTGTIDAGSSYYNRVVNANISVGDDLNIADLIDTDLNCLDLMRGFIELFNLKPEYDRVFNTVTFYPTDVHYQPENTIKPYYLKEEIDLTDKVICDTLQGDVSKFELDRNYELRFKRYSGDYFANLPEHEDYADKVLDFGEGYVEGSTEVVNSFFSKTINVFDYKHRFSNFNNPSNPNMPATLPYLPTIWSGEADKETGDYPEKAFKIGYRILMVYDFQVLTIPKELSNLEFDTFASVPIFDEDNTSEPQGRGYYCPAAHILPQEITGDLVVGFPDNSGNVTYGNVYDTGTYNKFIERSVRDLYYGLDYEVMIKLTSKEFNDFDFRKTYIFNYLSSLHGHLTVKGRVLKIIDYVYGGSLVTPVLIRTSSKVLSLNCCQCSVSIQFRGILGNIVSFELVEIGNCGDFISIKWELLTQTGNISILGSDEEFDVEVGGNANPNSYNFEIKATYVSSCETFIKTITYNHNG